MSVRQIFPFVLLLTAFLVPGCTRKSLDSVQRNWNRDRAKALVEQAQPIFTAGDYEQNVQLLKEAVRVDPGFALAWSRRCVGYQFRNEWEFALDACQRAAVLDPSDDTHNSLGQVYLKRRDYRSAADEFEKIARQPRDVETQDNLVTALLHSRQYEKA